MIDIDEMDVVGDFESQNPHHVHLARVDHGSAPMGQSGPSQSKAA